MSDLFSGVEPELEELESKVFVDKKIRKLSSKKKLDGIINDINKESQGFKSRKMKQVKINPDSTTAVISFVAVLVMLVAAAFIVSNIKDNDSSIEFEATPVAAAAEEEITQEVEEPVEKTKEVKELKELPKPKPVNIVIENPNNCDLEGNTEVVHPDGSCHAIIIPEGVTVNHDIEPKAPPTTQIAAGSGSCSLAYNYDWPSDIAYQICQFESRGDPNAANWADDHSSWAGCFGSFGLMQINCSHGQLYDGATNMATAYSMYKSWGNSFAAWTTCAKVSGCF